MRKYDCCSYDLMCLCHICNSLDFGLIRFVVPTLNPAYVKRWEKLCLKLSKLVNGCWISDGFFERNMIPAVEIRSNDSLLIFVVFLSVSRVSRQCHWGYILAAPAVWAQSSKNWAVDSNRSMCWVPRLTTIKYRNMMHFPVFYFFSYGISNGGWGTSSKNWDSWDI